MTEEIKTEEKEKEEKRETLKLPEKKEEKLFDLYENVEKKITSIIKGMEEVGILVDVSKLNDLSKEKLTSLKTKTISISLSENIT